MRILLTSTRGAGHVGPLLPFAHAWRRAGHDVLAAAPESARAILDRAGLPHRLFANASEEELGPVWATVPTLSAEEANRVVISEVFGRIHARAALPGLLETIESWRPDAVVRETSEFGACIAAELHGVPHVRVGVGLAAGEAFALDVAAGAIDALRREYGLPADPSAARVRSSRYLALVPPSFEDPADPGSGAFRFRDEGSGAAPDPWPGDERPLVYVSFGSVAPTMGFFPGLYEAAAQGLADLPIRVLMTVGDACDPADLGPPPANVRVEQWVPQREVMPHVAAVVGHGGFGSTLAALTAGVPQVIAPLFADQPQNARRVHDLGAGLSLWDGSGQLVPPPKAIAGLSGLPEAVRRVLAEPRYHEAAQRVAGEARALPPVDESAAVLAEVVAA